MMIITLFIIIVLIIIICFCGQYGQKRNEQFNDNHIHDNNAYPEMKFVFDNRHTIIKEFYSHILHSNKWSNWMEYDKIANTPIFSKMTHTEIINRMKKNSCEINKGKPSWKIFGLKLYGHDIKENVDMCPKTMSILNKCEGIVNAGFSCLEPNVITALHHDFNHDILRCHIPIIIPSGNTAIKINNKIYKWKDNEYFIFDDTYDHQAWNYTDKIRIVLIVDIKKNL